MSLNNIPPEEEPEGNPFNEFRDSMNEETPNEEPDNAGGSNRTFLTVIGVIGAVVLLAIIALVVYFLIQRGQLTNRFQEQAAQINAENTAVAMQATESALQELQQMTQKAMLPATWTPTGARTTLPPTATSTPRLTNTPVPTEGADSQARTATVIAFLTASTQSGGGGATQTQTTRTSATAFRTPTALPTTGFAEDAGLPGLLGLAFGLIVIVIIVRRLRLSTSR